MNANRDDAIRWSALACGEWRLHAAATAGGLCYVGSPGKPLEEAAAWLGRRYPGRPLVRDDRHMRPYLAELKQYLEGRRTSFAMPADLRGTPFQLAVWRALEAIPYGQTATYSDVAARIGQPAAVRAVGAAIGANPLLIAVPCHRVVGKDGALTGYRGGLDAKRRLLTLERAGAAAGQERRRA